jgi:carbonic anhydrase
MNCDENTAPIDISTTNVVGNCELKCDYQFNYTNGNPTIKNNGECLALTYDNSKSPSVKFNNEDYIVSEIYIYTPSLHSYNGDKTDAELIITHSSKSSGQFLLVCIPIVSNDSTTPASKLLGNIITEASNTTPTESESSSYSGTDFNLNTFVPKAQFFSYTATLPFEPCNISNVDYVVFNNLSDTRINISSTNLVTLQKIITPNIGTIKTNPTIQLFMNKTGSKSLIEANSDEIYIDCQPTGHSKEESYVVVKDNSSSQYQTEPITLQTIINNPLFQFIIGCIFLFLIIALFVFITSIIQGKSIKDTLNGLSSTKTESKLK